MALISFVFSRFIKCENVNKFFHFLRQTNLTIALNCFFKHLTLHKILTKILTLRTLNRMLQNFIYVLVLINLVTCSFIKFVPKKTTSKFDYRNPIRKYIYLKDEQPLHFQSIQDYTEKNKQGKDEVLMEEHRKRIRLFNNAYNPNRGTRRMI